MRHSHFASSLCLLGFASANAPVSPGLHPRCAIPDASNSTTAGGVACACEQLQQLYPDIYLTSSSSNYTTEITDFWDVRSDLHPSCILLPTTADQVAKAVTIFHDCDAEFAIRGGGHMNFPGANNIDSGVLLALNGLTHLQVDATQETIEVGPGNRWVDVYTALAPYGLYAIGGRMKTIGVPGLTLIGGVHYFINKYGFAMDRVVSYDVVLGNGTAVVANATSNPDLFWALKGGANNFGVVTKFTLQAFSAPQISTTIQQFNESAVPAFIQAVCDFVIADDASIGSGAIISINYNATTKVVSPSILGVQEGTESPPSRFANFSAIPAVFSFDNVTTPVQWHSALDSPNQMFRVQFAHHTIKPDADQIYFLYQSWKAAVDDISDVAGLYPTFVLNIAPKSAAAVAQNNGVGNVWGLDDSEPYIWWQVSTGWESADDDLRMTAWSRSLVTRLHALNKAKNLSTEFLYMGDAGEWQDPFAGFAPENVEKMRQVRDVYDVDRVFSRLNWGGFKMGY